MADTVRVLLLAPTPSPHTSRWLAGLASVGLDVHFLGKKDPQLSGIPFHDYSPPPWRPWRLKRWHHRLRQLFRDTVAKIAPDVIHLHFPGPYTIDPADLKGIPLVVTPWGSEILLRDEQPVEVVRRRSEILRAASAVTATSRYLADATARYAGLPDEAVLVHHWGVDVELFRRAAPPVDEPVIGFPKHLQPHYAPDVVLQAFASLRRNSVPEARLIMMSYGTIEAELRQLAQELGVAEAVSWPGYVSHQEMPRWLERCAIAVMPSRRESFGVTSLEAQAMEVPVIASVSGGLPETLIDGETGLLVPPDDPTALAAAMAALLNDRDRRRAMGQSARRLVETRFNWDDTLIKSRELYRSLF